MCTYSRVPDIQSFHVEIAMCQGVNSFKIEKLPLSRISALPNYFNFSQRWNGSWNHINYAVSRALVHLYLPVGSTSTERGEFRVAYLKFSPGGAGYELNSIIIRAAWRSRNFFCVLKFRWIWSRCCNWTNVRGLRVIGKCVERTNTRTRSSWTISLKY